MGREHDEHDEYRKIVNAAEDNGWKVVPLCVEVGCRGYINDKWHHMVRALKLDKKMNKRLKNAVSDVVVRCSYYLYAMVASARVEHHKAAGLRF